VRIGNFDPASVKGRCRRCGHRNDNPDSEVCEQCWVDMGQMSFETMEIEEEDQYGERG
jgi:ribosomal protein L37E